jgi:hypothetical protein
VRLLERGGDDMLVKPFSIPSCAPGSPLCSGAPPCRPQPFLLAGPLRIDLNDRSVSVDERPVEFSAVDTRCGSADRRAHSGVDESQV